MPIFARAAYADGLDTSTLLLLRFALAAALLWTLFLVRGERLPGRRGLLMLAGMGGIGYAGQAFSYFTALTLASAGLVALLLYLYPALVTLLSRLLGHHLSGAQVLLVGMALLGSVLTIGRAGDGKPLGIFFGLLAALIYSGYILVGSRLPADVTPAASSALVATSAGLVYGAVALFRGVRLPQSAAGWGAVAAIAVVCTVLAIAFFLAGLARIGPVKASIYSTVEPAFTLLLAALLLGETVTALRLVGGALIIGAVILLARLDLRRAPL
ncbi:MAG: DMT family transporter [Deltaproteobacteria bacterium]|nr:DMT family transporter [Deltaproteobacteria bacterium]